jgi:hypothetical protein
MVMLLLALTSHLSVSLHFQKRGCVRARARVRACICVCFAEHHIEISKIPRVN